MTFILFPDLHTHSKRIFFPLAIRASSRLTNALIADSESTRQDTIRLVNIPPEKIHTVLLGIDPTFTPLNDVGRFREVREKYLLPDPFILYVGLVEPRKNLPALIRAYRELVDKGLAHDLVVVGRFGWMSEGIIEQVERLNLSKRIRFTGYIPQEDLPWVYNLSDLFVYPTRYEGFGFPVLEALACGVPVITTNVASLPEIIGEAGLLVPPDDDEALANMMANVLSNPDVRSDLAAKGPVRARQFSWELTAKETLKIYQRVWKTL
jgi:glycosyltransferase involved in cell wall biosynthesis